MPKTLEELKEENKLADEQEESISEEEENLEDDENLEDEDLEDDEDDFDDEDDDEDKGQKIESWMDTEDPDKKKDKDFVPVGAHVEMKNKLRGRLEDKDDELEKLKAENLKLKQVSTPQEPLKRPDPEDYTDQTLFDKDLETFKDNEAADRFRRIQANDNQTAKQQEAKRVVKENVDEHYDRSAKLVSESGIEPELFKQTDLKVRKTIENLRPGFGDVITDNLISTLGKGSEKVMYYLGVNETALNKFQALLVADPSGMRAAVFLGQEQQRLTTPKKQRSRAPKPSKQHSGNTNLGGNAKSLKRKYDVAHKKGDINTAYKIKQQAKKNKINTSGWLGE